MAVTSEWALLENVWNVDEWNWPETLIEDWNLLQIAIINETIVQRMKAMRQNIESRIRDKVFTM